MEKRKKRRKLFEVYSCKWAPFYAEEEEEFGNSGVGLVGKGGRGRCPIPKFQLPSSPHHVASVKFTKKHFAKNTKCWSNYFYKKIKLGSFAMAVKNSWVVFESTSGYSETNETNSVSSSSSFPPHLFPHSSLFFTSPTYIIRGVWVWEAAVSGFFWKKERANGGAAVNTQMQKWRQ